MRDEAELWWEQAKHDHATAVVLLDGERLDAAIFYVQQSVEKALKAVWLGSLRTRPETTHSLVRLGRECGVPARFIGFLRRLTPEYYLSRYPDASGEAPYRLYEQADVAETVALATEVIEWAGLQLTR
jgi:HEPN domain-containing protein